MSKLAEITYFCKITSTTSCLVYWREKYYLCRSSQSVWINEGSSDVWIQWCRHEVSIYPSVVQLNWYQYIYYSDAMHRPWIPVLKWNNTLLLFEAVCYKKHSEGDTCFREFKSKKRNLFVRTFGFSTIIVEGASLRSNIINYCMWLSCAYYYNNILLEISGSHSYIISDSYIFHYGNELVSHTGNKEIRYNELRSKVPLCMFWGLVRDWIDFGWIIPLDKRAILGLFLNVDVVKEVTSLATVQLL